MDTSWDFFKTDGQRHFKFNSENYCGYRKCGFSEMLFPVNYLRSSAHRSSFKVSRMVVCLCQRANVFL